jgi:glutathione synthase/RimK-type ligase-like ATP-grasp enzyme
MLKINLQVAQAGKETGALLRQYLYDRGVSVVDSARPVVCYGLPTNTKPNLNGNCGTDKIERLRLMENAGVATIPWFSADNIIGLHYPLLARKSNGYGGKDIVPVFQPEELPWRIKAGWEWFSEYIPVHTEYRVWTFHNTALDTYEKVMQRPHEYKGIGRNFGNGFEFRKTANHEGPTELAIAATAALGLDFAAVDLLGGMDGALYVLEVNTAPGVIRSGAQATLGKLADRIASWAKEL